MHIEKANFKCLTLVLVVVEPVYFNKVTLNIKEGHCIDSKESKRCLDTAENFHTNRLHSSREMGHKTKRLFRTNKLKTYSGDFVSIFRRSTKEASQRLSIFHPDWRPPSGPVN